MPLAGVCMSHHCALGPGLPDCFINNMMRRGQAVPQAGIEAPAFCVQVASQHVPKGASDYVTIAYVPLLGEQ